MLTESDFERAGTLCSHLSFTPEELQLVHDATECVLKYMNAREKAGMPLVPIKTQSEACVVLFSLRAFEWLERVGIVWHSNEEIEPAIDVSSYLELRNKNIMQSTKDLLGLDIPPAPQLTKNMWELQYLRAKCKWLETKKEHKCQDVFCKECDEPWLKFCKTRCDKY